MSTNFELVINGQSSNLSIKYGRSVRLIYDSIVDMAGFRGRTDLTVTYRFGDRAGTLSSGDMVDVPIDQKAIFNVAGTSGA